MPSPNRPYNVMAHSVHGACCKNILAYCSNSHAPRCRTQALQWIASVATTRTKLLVAKMAIRKGRQLPATFVAWNSSAFWCRILELRQQQSEQRKLFAKKKMPFTNSGLVVRIANKQRAPRPRPQCTYTNISLQSELRVTTSDCSYLS